MVNEREELINYSLTRANKYNIDDNPPDRNNAV